MAVVERACVTMPTGFVKSTIQAPLFGAPAVSSAAPGRGARSAAPWRTRRRRSSPGRSRRTRAAVSRRRAGPPGRRPAAGGDEVGTVEGRIAVPVREPPGQPSRPSIRRASPPTTSSRSGRCRAGRARRSAGAPRVARTLDQLRGVRAPAADDRDPGPHPTSGVLTGLLITLSAFEPAQPKVRPPIQRRSASVGQVPARARPRPAAPPGLSRPARLPRFRSLVAGRQAPTERELARHTAAA
jgi:hypothetical protein